MKTKNYIKIADKAFINSMNIHLNLSPDIFFWVNINITFANAVEDNFIVLGEYFGPEVLWEFYLQNVTNKKFLACRSWCTSVGHCRWNLMSTKWRSQKYRRRNLHHWLQCKPKNVRKRDPDATRFPRFFLKHPIVPIWPVNSTNLRRSWETPGDEMWFLSNITREIIHREISSSISHYDKLSLYRGLTSSRSLWNFFETTLA